MDTAAILAVAGEPNPLVPVWTEVAVGAVAFAILYFFLSRKVFPVFERTYAQRTEAIEGGMARAEAAQREAQEALEAYRAQLADARSEASRIRTEAQSDRKAIVEEARREAQVAAEQVTERSRVQIQSEITQARAELSRDVGRLAVDLAGRVVGENLSDTDRTRATVERFIADLEAVSADGGQGTTGASSLDADPAGPR